MTYRRNDCNGERTRNDVVDLPRELRVRRRNGWRQNCEWQRTPNHNHTAFRPRGRRFRVGAQLHGRDSVTTRIAYLPTVSPANTHSIVCPRVQPNSEQKPSEKHLKHVVAKIKAVFLVTEFGSRLKKNINKKNTIGSYDKYDIIGM